MANQAALALAALTARDAARRSRQHATLQREEERRNLRRAVHDELTNAARHAGATRVVVSLQRSPCWLRLVVDDDGRGFVGTSAGGVGVVSMRERAEELGGQCLLESSPMGGARVDATFALVAP